MFQDLAQESTKSKTPAPFHSQGIKAIWVEEGDVFTFPLGRLVQPRMLVLMSLLLLACKGRQVGIRVPGCRGPVGLGVFSTCEASYPFPIRKGCKALDAS